MDLNKVMIIGRLTQDPEMRTTPQGAAVASFSVATNLTWNDASGQKQEKVEFHNVVVWRKLAEICGQYLKKGSKAYFEGRLQTRNWEGQDGVRRYRTEIIIDNMIMLDSRGGAAAGGNSFSAPAQGSNSVPDFANTEIPSAYPTSSQGGHDDDEIKVENIPF